MKKINLAIGISIGAVLASAVLISCKKETVQAQQPASLSEPNLPAATYDYASKHGVEGNLATLGRVLFYDKNLSGNKTISCGSCHKQEYAFADNVQFNKGANGIALKRNSPSIQGIKGFRSEFSFFNTQNGTQVTSVVPGMPTKTNQTQVLLFWDGRQRSVSDMVLNPVLNHNEMNTPDLDQLVVNLGQLSYYPGLFKNAFGDAAITKERISFALEGFLACLNTTSLTVVDGDGTIPFSEFEGTANNNFIPPVSTAGDATLTPLERQGKFLFHSKYNCAQCHDPSNQGSYGTVTSPTQMFNIGLDEVYADKGLGALTHLPGDQGIFKVPTLKNISLTAPYMHDGRFANLGEVLDHYSHNIKANANLSPKFLNVDGTPKKLNIQPAEKQALIAFLNTLKDDDFLTSPMYSDPFKK